MYLARLWSALGEQGTDIDTCPQDDLDALIDRTRTIRDGEVLRAACHALATHAMVAWGPSIWRLLEVAASHEEPHAGENTIHSNRDGGMQPDVEASGLNSVRGAAARALGTLVWNDTSRAAQGSSLASRLADDPHAGVRMMAAYVALGIYTTDKDAGVALLLGLVNHADDRILACHGVRTAISHMRWSHPDALHPLFERMVRSPIAKVAEVGAGWVAAEYFQRNGACAGSYQQCAQGTIGQRVGIASTLPALLVAPEADTRTLAGELVRCFHDVDSAVRDAAAHRFLSGDVLHASPGPTLAEAFASSPAFEKHARTLVQRLGKVPDVLAYAPAIFASAARLAHELAEKTRSFQYALGLAGRELSALLLRLYDRAGKAGEQDTARACLDHWDALLKNRVGDAEAHLEAYDPDSARAGT